MRITIAIICALVTFGLAASGFAQEDEPDEQFVKIEPFLIDGELKVPQATRVDGRGEIRFGDLFELEKKSFIDRVDHSTDDPSLD